MIDPAVLGVGFDRWLTFTLTEAALSLAPGPAVALVVACGLARGARSSVWATLGILCANAVYFVLSATSLGAVLAASPAVFTAIKWIGAAYLVWLGLSAVFGRASPLSLSAWQGERRTPRAIFTSGLTLQLANPKALLMFLAILPPFVDPHAPVMPQMALFAASSIVPEFAILLGYGWLASRAQQLATRPGYALWTERAAGSLLLLAAGLVAFGGLG